MIELAIILPLLMGIVLSVLDIGIGFKISLTVSNAARAGARTASNFGRDMSADQAALAGVSAALGTIPQSEIDLVVIYRASSSSGTVPAGCLTSTARALGGSPADYCNVYVAADLAAAPSAAGYTGDCTTSRDRFWCTANRENSQTAANGPDYLGVYVRINHATSTKVFGSTMVIDDQAIMRIEPNAGS